MVFSNINHHSKPNYYNHATTTLFLNISIFLLSPLLVNGQYLHHHHHQRPDHQSSSPVYLGMAFAAGTIVIIVIFIIINLYCKHNPAARVRAHDGPARRPSIGLDPVVVESFPVFKYSEVSAHRADTGLLECAVCLSPFEVDDDEKLRLLPKCNHVFHVSCVDPWFKDHSTCPLCRADLVPKPYELTEPVSGQVAEFVSNEVTEVNEVGNNFCNASEVRGDIEEGLYGKYKRWKSMGHVAEVKQVDEEGWKRFTLKLPEEKMKKLGEKRGNLKRTRSSL